MTYGTIQHKNGKISGRLKFNTGKIVKLTQGERQELEQKIRDWNYQAVEQNKIN